MFNMCVCEDRRSVELVETAAAHHNNDTVHLQLYYCVQLEV